MLPFMTCNRCGDWFHSGGDRGKRVDHVRLAATQIRQEESRMDYINNNGEKIGSLTVAIGKDKTVTINRLNDVTTVTTQDRTTGKFSTETFFGDSPFGK
jgi:hypothetical protein